MNKIYIFASTLGLCALALSQGTLSAQSLKLEDITSEAALNGMISGTSDADTKAALKSNSAAILNAAAKKPHVEYVIAVLDKNPGEYEKVNVTPESLKTALGGESPVFDTLKMVNLSKKGMSIKAKRESNPFDAEFYEHLGKITDLESLRVLHTKPEDAWLAPLANLTNLKKLDLINVGLSDEGLAHLSGLKQLERFGFIGTMITGHPFKDFKGWTNLTSSSFRGSKIDDEGLGYLCESFPNYESLCIPHAHFTDAGAAGLSKLKNLTALEIGSREATPQCLKNITELPIEYLQLGDGLDAAEGVAIIKDMPTLRRLTLTNCKEMTDADLAVVTGMTQLNHLEMVALNITDERLALLKKFTFLGSMRLVRYGEGYTQEIQDKVSAALPKVNIRFD